MSVSQQRHEMVEAEYDGDDPLLARARRLADELARRWANGERPLAEEFLADDPELAARADAALDIVYEEMCQRPPSEALDDDRWFARFPTWRAELEMLLACHRLLEGAAGPRFPEAGEKLGEFLLTAELGRGLHGCVYLARQPALADRPVVLKVTPLTGQEHLALARLQHTHIVPLYGVYDEPLFRLRALCMPYFGGATLAAVLEGLRTIAPARRTGRDLLQALTAAAESLPFGPAIEGPACRYLAQAGYVEAVCWIVACLADALDDAHQRGIVHLDLKPSNVLLAADGQPMLLDFHLAQPPIAPGAAALEWLGGTPGYMPPEQEAALDAVRQGGEVHERVDGRADIYALGVLLSESLAARPPAGTSPARWLRTANPNVGTALADLVGKCLSARAEQRYSAAGALAEDLRRHLAHRPLKHVANRNLVERWRKWRRRRPYSLAFLALFTALATWGVAAAAGVRHRTGEAQSSLGEAAEHLTAGRFDQAVTAARRAQELAGALPWGGGLVDRVRQIERGAQAGNAAHQLHTLVDRLLVLAGGEELRSSDARRLHQQAERLWQRRDVILGNFSQVGLNAIAQRASADLAKLAVLWADLHLRLAPADGAATARREALAVLHDANELPGAAVLVARAQRHLLGLPERPSDEVADAGQPVPPASAWEHLILGRFLLSEGELAPAAAEFAAATELEPQSLWANFYSGRAAYALGHYDDAVASLTACVALAPRAAWCYFNRGLAYAALAQLAAARRDFDRALELEPGFATAALHRGSLSYREDRYAEAVADLTRALDGGADPAEAHYRLALVYSAQRNRVAALKHVDQALSIDAAHQPARELLTKLRGAE